MTYEYVISLADPRATLAIAGGKGASLARLCAAGLPVPGGFHVTTAAYNQFVAENNLQPRILAALQSADISQPVTLEATSRAIHDVFIQARMPPEIAEAIAQAYKDLPGDHPVVAVRSSATAEDLPGLSFAGQQETFLNIHGVEAVLDAVKRCWASLWTARAIGYRAQHNIDHNVVSLAVVVQMLVHAEAAGILFTVDPINGRRGEAMITAAWGLGEAIVGGLVTPDTLTVDKATGRVLSRETADKQVMTVRLASGTEEQPVPEDKRSAPVLDDQQAAELARLGVQIEKLYNMPMDIEWTLMLPSPSGRGAGGEGAFAIVQARPITALPEPEAPIPTEWKLPDPKGRYARGSVVEFIPDPLTPLFGTLGAAIIDANTRRLFAAIAGRDVHPNGMVHTINGYAYLNIKFAPSDMLRFLVGTIRLTPDMLGSGERRWHQDARPRYLSAIYHWQARPLGDLTSAEILTGVREILDGAIYLYTMLQSGIVAAALSAEALFTSVYDKMIKRQGDPPVLTYLLGFDSTPILAEKALYDLAIWCRARAGLAAYLANTPTRTLVSQLSSDQTPPGVETDDWSEWQGRFRAHLQQYGHTIYDLDFAKPVPADDPTPLIETCKLYMSGQGTDPHARQRAAEERRQQATETMLKKLKGLRLKIFRKLVGWAQTTAPMREDSIADLGLGYPLLRQMLLELGRRLFQAGAIEQAADIFWLYETEVVQAARDLDRGEPVSRLAEGIPQRKAVWRAERRVPPPPGLPVGQKFFGMDLEKIGPARVSGQTGDVLKGAGTSSGRVTAPACVLYGPEDFDQMKPGQVLVAAITTPAWTPLFAMAAAVVTDIGGPLSHGSIVAREYGIPAVMGTGVATKRIKSGQTITVDGSAGTVTLATRLEPAASTSIEWKLPNPKGQYMRGSVVDILPDPVSPLFATLAIPAVAGIGVKQVLGPLTRSEPLLPDDYILTINDYAYMGVAYTPRQWWWILTRMIAAFPRIIREAIPLWRDEIRPRYVATVAHWQSKPPDSMPIAELWAAIREINEAAMLHLTSLLVATTGAAAGSEGLFTRVYEKMIRREGDPAAVTFLMGYDSTPIRAEKSLYDVAMWCQEWDGLAAYLRETPVEQLAAQLADGQTPVAGWPEFCERFQAYLQDYGHIIYNLDFAKPLPLDDATPMLGTIKMYLESLGVNPHERQRAAEEKRVQAAEEMLKRLKGLRRWSFRKTLGMAQTMAAVRENALSDIGLGYPLLREMLRELGRRFVRAGIIAQSEDIFWLQQHEVGASIELLVRGETPSNMAEHVAQRQATHEALKRVTPPPMLPPKKKYMGIDMASFTPVAAESQTGGALKGIGASAGRATATACVLRSPEDFDQMRPGDVLVASSTTPAWTPLFAMASAVVTDIGGPLSHGSIVAREYGIPAVMGTGVATRRIHSGQVITVDGSVGIVTLSQNGT